MNSANKSPLPTGFSSVTSPQPLRFRPAAGLDVRHKMLNAAVIPPLLFVVVAFSQSCENTANSRSQLELSRRIVLESQNPEKTVRSGFDNIFGGREKYSTIWNRSEEFSEFPSYRFYFATPDLDSSVRGRSVMAVVGVHDHAIRYIECRKSGVAQLNFLLSNVTIDDLKSRPRLSEQLCRLVQEVAESSGCVIWTADHRNYFYFIDGNLKEVDVGFLHRPKVDAVGDDRAEIRFFSTGLNVLWRNSVILSVTDKSLKVVSYSEEWICNMIERP